MIATPHLFPDSKNIIIGRIGLFFIQVISVVHHEEASWPTSSTCPLFPYPSSMDIRGWPHLCVARISRSKQTTRSIQTPHLSPPLGLFHCPASPLDPIGTCMLKPLILPCGCCSCTCGFGYTPRETYRNDKHLVRRKTTMGCSYSTDAAGGVGGQQCQECTTRQQAAFCAGESHGCNITSTCSLCACVVLLPCADVCNRMTACLFGC